MEIVETVLLWLLGIVSLAAGATKAFTPIDRLVAQPNMDWIERTGPAQARLAGWAEVLAGLAFIGTALGIWFLGDTDALAVIAALGLATIMGLAAVRVHRPAGESVVPNLAIGTLALLLALLLVV